jgi:ectoine hydroxylase-related dioxygenase (phytanoyl-CoA dioxygenase family)
MLEDTFEINEPRGGLIRIPVSVSSNDIYLDMDESEREKHFKERGFVIFRNLIPHKDCEELVDLFKKDVKPFKGIIPRFPYSKFEANKFDRYGHVINRISDLQRIRIPKLEDFVGEGFDVATHPSLIGQISVFMDDLILAPVYYFEGNARTQLHQDLHYFPEFIERTVTGWIALEEIRPGAGRLAVYPGSHKISSIPSRGSFGSLNKSGGYQSQAARRTLEHIKASKQAVIDTCIDCEAPALNKGDALIFDGRLIHGSLESRTPEFSRHSLTALFIPKRGVDLNECMNRNGVYIVKNPSSY